MKITPYYELKGRIDSYRDKSGKEPGLIEMTQEQLESMQNDYHASREMEQVNGVWKYRGIVIKLGNVMKVTG